jgi:hypothetical protein
VRKARSPRRRGSSSAGYSCRRGHAERAARYCRPEYPTYDPDSVALPGPARRALVLVGSDVLGNFELHQLLSHGPHALAQEVDVLVELGLAQQLLKRHPQILGHRLVPPFGDQDNPDGNRRWPAASSAYVKSPHIQGLDWLVGVGASCSHVAGAVGRTAPHVSLPPPL